MADMLTELDRRLQAFEVRPGTLPHATPVCPSEQSPACQNGPSGASLSGATLCATGADALRPGDYLPRYGREVSEVRTHEGGRSVEILFAGSDGCRARHLARDVINVRREE